MARRRRSFRPARLLLLVLLGCLLILLLELNRFLPGGWPGGGPTGGPRHEGSMMTTERVRPPEAPPPAWPAEGRVVRIRVPGGGTARLGVGRSGPWTEVGPDGLAIRDGRAAREGLRVETDAGRWRYGPLDADDGAPVVLHPPATIPRDTPPSTGPRTVQIVALEDGRPLTDARIDVLDAVAPSALRTDADGQVNLPDDLGDLVMVRAQAPGRAPRHRRLASTGSEVVLALAPSDAVRVRGPDGSPAPAHRERWLGPDGRVLWERGATPPPAALPEGAVLEVQGRPDGVVAHVPVDRAEPVVALGETARITVSAPAGGSPLRVTARYRPHRDEGHASDEEPEARVQVEGDTPLGIDVPLGTTTHLLVEARGRAPELLELDVQGDQQVTAADQPGGSIEVRVVRAGDLPVRDAEVIARTTVGLTEVLRRTRTDVHGRARVTGLPPGSDVEVYAHAPGTTWTLAGTRAVRDGQDPVLELARGAPIHLRVESPLGDAIPGVRVLVEPEGTGAAPDVVPPGADPWRTDDDGRLTIEDRPSRTYRVRLSASGYEETVLRGVTPGTALHFATMSPRAR